MQIEVSPSCVGGLQVLKSINGGIKHIRDAKATFYIEWGEIHQRIYIMYVHKYLKYAIKNALFSSNARWSWAEENNNVFFIHWRAVVWLLGSYLIVASLDSVSSTSSSCRVAPGQIADEIYIMCKCFEASARARGKQHRRPREAGRTSSSQNGCNMSNSLYSLRNPSGIPLLCVLLMFRCKPIRHWMIF